MLHPTSKQYNEELLDFTEVIYDFFFSEIETLYINRIAASTVIFFGLDFDRHAESDYFIVLAFVFFRVKFNIKQIKLKYKIRWRCFPKSFKLHSIYYKIHNAGE